MSHPGGSSGSPQRFHDTTHHITQLTQQRTPPQVGALDVLAAAAPPPAQDSPIDFQASPTVTNVNTTNNSTPNAMDHLRDYEYMSSEFIAPTPLNGSHETLMDQYGVVTNTGLDGYTSDVFFTIQQLIEQVTFSWNDDDIPTFPVMFDPSIVDPLINNNFIKNARVTFQEKPAGGGGGGGDGDGGGDDDGDDYDDLTDDEDNDEDLTPEITDAERKRYMWQKQQKQNRKQSLDQWRGIFLALSTYIDHLSNTVSYQKAFHYQHGNEFRILSRARDAYKSGNKSGTDIDVRPSCLCCNVWLQLSNPSLFCCPTTLAETTLVLQTP